MRSLEQASDLTLRLYEAAQDRSLLPAFMSELAKQFKAHMAGLRIHDASHSVLNSHYLETVGLSAPEWEAHDVLCGERNIWRTKGRDDLLAHGVGHDGMIAPRKELIRTDFYKLLRIVDVDYGMGICLWTGPQNQAAILSLNRSPAPGPFGAPEVAYAKHLLPHFRSAYAIMRRLSWMESKCSSLASAIDRLHVGMLLVSPAGTCVYHNEIAEQVLGQRDGIVLTAARGVRCMDASAQLQLNDAVLRSAQGALHAPSRIHNRDETGKVSLILVVTMVRGDVLPHGPGEEPCAAIFLHLPSNSPKNAEVLLRDAWRLTLAEARLAALLAEGNEVSRCAEMLGVSVATVRTQLRGLLAKTDTRRQAELVSALAFALRAQ